MRVGFTGTRSGMTIKQWKTFADQILNVVVTEWHDGDCIGADAQANGVLWRYKKEIAFFNPIMHGWPCNHKQDKYRAFNEYDTIHDEENPPPPLKRNRYIVDNSDVMFAAPSGYDEIKQGSGTWATIRYARKQNKPLCIIWPDGSFTRERWNAIAAV